MTKFGTIKEKALKTYKWEKEEAAEKRPSQFPGIEGGQQHSVKKREQNEAINISLVDLTDCGQKRLYLRDYSPRS